MNEALNTQTPDGADNAASSTSPALAAPIVVTLNGKEYRIAKVAGRQIDTITTFSKEIKQSHRSEVRELRDNGEDPDAVLEKARVQAKKKAEAEGKPLSDEEVAGITLASPSARVMINLVANVIGQGIDADDLYDNTPYGEIKVAAEAIMKGVSRFLSDYAQSDPEVKK